MADIVLAFFRRSIKILGPCLIRIDNFFSVVGISAKIL